MMDIVHSRTWLTLPGAAASSGSNIVCMESMMTTVGSVESMAAPISPRSVSASTYISPSETPSRCARIFSCRRLSSPVT